MEGRLRAASYHAASASQPTRESAVDDDHAVRTGSR
jgi:hypothetical protein